MLKIKAKICLYKNNGRKTPFKSGYRPLFDIKNSKYSGMIDLINKKDFFPGEEDIVYISFINLIDLNVDDVLFFSEGLANLGEAIVLEILDK